MFFVFVVFDVLSDDGFPFRQKESLGATVKSKKIGLTMTFGGGLIERGRVCYTRG